MKRVAAVALVAACSSPAAPPCADAAVCNDECPASFSGNFSDDSIAVGNCAQLTPQLEFSLASPAIGSPAMISIELGATPVAGTFSSETVASWTAVQARSIDDGACVYSAGNAIVPAGSFTLTLVSIDAMSAHGTLDIVEYVHALEGTACGPNSTETVHVVF